MATCLHDSQIACDTLSRIIRASRTFQSCRACLMVTYDREQAMHLVIDASRRCEVPLYHLSVAARRQYAFPHLEWHEVGSGDADPAVLLEAAQNTAGGGVFVIEGCLHALTDGGAAQQARMRLADMLAATSTAAGSVLVFIEPPKLAGHVPQMLAEQFVKFDLPYPRGSELEAIAREEIAAIAHETRTPVTIETIRLEAGRFADALTGTTRKAARDTVRDALCAAPADFESALRFLQQRKTDRLSRELAMKVLETADAEVPIGLESLMQYLEVQKVRMRVTGFGRARGVLLVGPPGTGKTMLAKAIGKLVELPVVEFRIASLMNSLLGETEHLFAKAFATLEAMSPSVVFIDEIEKAFGDSSERDGGTMMRVTGSLLSWLSDNPYPNYIVATCNSLTRMGEIGLTMTRSERFDAAYFVDVPGRKARAQMLERWLASHIDDHRAIAAHLAQQTEKCSGADLFSAVKQALAQATHEGQPLGLRHLESEIERKTLRVEALYKEFDRLRHWGRIYCEPAGETD